MKEKVAGIIFKNTMVLLGADFYPEDYQPDSLFARKTAEQILNLFKAEVDKLTMMQVPDHSESIWCPHCGEEFGIETNIEGAYDVQLQHTKKELLR